MEKFSIFVPGRLCIFGEHSDWAANYQNQNSAIENGYAIATCIEEGIYADVQKCNKFILKQDDLYYEAELNNLKETFDEDNYYSYATQTVSYMITHYEVLGVEITITKQTLPQKAGLSSSAAICVLIVKAFNQLYNLNLSIDEEMEIAYLSERKTGSLCGKLDQIVALQNKMIVMEFSTNSTSYKELVVGKSLYFVYANLNGIKDTKKILQDLHSAYPFPKNRIDEKVIEYLGKINKEIVFEAIENIKIGNVQGIGKLLIKAQSLFDKYISPKSSKLCAPKLHQVLADDYIQKLTYGGKGVGSQGDGSIQFLARNKDSQMLLKTYLNEQLHIQAFTLTIPATKRVSKAIIPMAGLGVRMYPYTRSIPKSFIPIVDNGSLKPIILKLLEELDEAGIEQIFLVIAPQHQKYYEDFFKPKNNNIDSLEEILIQKISKKIRYIYQHERFGLGHAVYLCKDYIQKEPVLLVLGDQFFESNINKNCTQQLLEKFNDTNKLTVSICPVKLEKVHQYGIFYGKLTNEDDNYFDILNIVEKPSFDFALNNLGVDIKNQKNFYAAFGEYILTEEFFKELELIIKKGLDINNEVTITDALYNVSKKSGAIAFIPNGIMYDVGNIESYLETVVGINNRSKKI